MSFYTHTQSLNMKEKITNSIIFRLYIGMDRAKQSGKCGCGSEVCISSEGNLQYSFHINIFSVIFGIFFKKKKNYSEQHGGFVIQEQTGSKTAWWHSG